MIRIAEIDKLLLKLPGYWIMEYRFEMPHHWLHKLSYHIPYFKSIPKKQQNILKNSTRNTALFALAAFDLSCRHGFSLYLNCTVVVRIALGLPLCGESIRQLFEPSVNVSRAWTMISFWVETPFWVSCLHAQPVLPVTPKIPLELKGDRSGVPLFQGGTSYYVTFPAAHGLDVQGLTLINRIKGSAVDLTSTHAALVFLKKNEPRRTRRPAKKNIRPRMARMAMSQINKYNFRRGEPLCSPDYYYRLNGFIWDPPLIAPTGRAFWVMRQANFEDFGRQDNHSQPPRRCSLLLLQTKPIKEKHK